jgi:hypothetical protein
MIALMKNYSFIRFEENPFIFTGKAFYEYLIRKKETKMENN